MDTQRRNLIIAIIALGVIAIAVILWLVFRNPIPTSAPEDFEILDLQTDEVREEPQASAVPPVITAESATAVVVSRNFVERFGTYSTDVPYENYEDVRELVTSEFYNRLLSGRVASDSTGYAGVTARALSVQKVAGDESVGSIDYDVTVQLEEFRDSRSSRSVRYTHGFVTVVRQGDAWFVSNFEWE